MQWSGLGSIPGSQALGKPLVLTDFYLPPYKGGSGGQMSLSIIPASPFCHLASPREERAMHACVRADENPEQGAAGFNLPVSTFAARLSVCLHW